MRIREAVTADAPALTAMGVRFVQQSSYCQHLAINPEHLQQFMERCIAQTIGESAILVSEDDAGLAGMFGVLVSAHPFSGERIAGDLFWWVEPSRRGHGRDLMDAAVQWAKDRGAVRFQMVAPTDRVGRFYERCGYTRLETTYQRSL